MKNLKEKYSSCNHVLVGVKKDYDKHEGRTSIEYGCIKCGLDFSVYNDRNFLTPLQKEMLEYLSEKQNYVTNIYKSVYSWINCDLELGCAICAKIKEKYPNIDDKTLIKYFNTALNDIRNIEVNGSRKESRVKRLNLNPKFNRWKSINGNY